MEEDRLRNTKNTIQIRCRQLQKQCDEQRAEIDRLTHQLEQITKQVTAAVKNEAIKIRSDNGAQLNYYLTVRDIINLSKNKTEIISINENSTPNFL